MTWDTLEGLTPQAYNTQFLQKLAADPGAIAQVGDNFVRDRLREDMVFNQIIPQNAVTPDKCQVSLNGDTLYEVIHLEPNAAASIMDFRGTGRGQVVSAPRVPLGFHMLKSDEFEVVEQELLVYPYPIVTLVHNHAIKAIGDQHDLYMLQSCQRAVDYVDANPAYKGHFGGGTVQGVDADGAEYTSTLISGTDGRLNSINSYSVTRGKNALSNRIRAAKMLMAQADHNALDSLQLFEQGDRLRSEVFVKGYTAPTWTGLDLVVTTKADIFRPGIVWLFAAPDFLGKNRVLDYGGGAYKLFIDRRSNVITFHVYANFGALIANVGSLARLQLFGGSVTAAYGRPNSADSTVGDNYVSRAFSRAQTAAQDGIEAVTGRVLTPGDADPLSITGQEMYRQRNLAESGGRFPVVTAW